MGGSHIQPRAGDCLCRNFQRNDHRVYRRAHLEPDASQREVLDGLRPMVSTLGMEIFSRSNSMKWEEHTVLILALLALAYVTGRILAHLF